MGDNCRIYVGNLPEDIRRDEVAELLAKYGRVRDIDIKCGRTRNGTAYAFVEFDHPGAAEEAVERCDNISFGGGRLRVEFTGQRKPKRHPGGYAGSGPPIRSDYRVIVLGLPKQVSWQDLKDHMRLAGNVGYAVIDDEHRGIVEYESERGQLRALEKLHRSEFRNPFARSIIKVYTEEQLEERRSISPRGRSRSPRRVRNYETDRKRMRSSDERDEGKRRRYADNDDYSDSASRRGGGSPSRSGAAAVKSRRGRSPSASPRDDEKTRSPPSHHFSGKHGLSPRHRGSSRSPQDRSASPSRRSQDSARSQSPRGGRGPSASPPSQRRSPSLSPPRGSSVRASAGAGEDEKLAYGGGKRHSPTREDEKVEEEQK